MLARVPPQSLPYATDFRTAATSASLNALRRTGSDPADVTASGLSLCLPAAGDADRFRRHFGRTLLALAVVGFGGWALALASVIVAFTAVPAPYRIPVAMSAFPWFLAGSAVMAAAKPVQSVMLRRHRASMPYAEPPFARGVAPRVVTVEQPDTVSQMKVVAEDVADLYLDAARGVVVLEGFSHRYVIWGDDVVRASVRRTRLSDFVVLQYRMAGTAVLLEVAVNYSTAETIRKRQAKQLPRPPLVGWVEETLGITVAD